MVRRQNGYTTAGWLPKV